MSCVAFLYRLITLTISARLFTAAGAAPGKVPPAKASAEHPCPKVENLPRLPQRPGNLSLQVNHTRDTHKWIYPAPPPLGSC